MVYEKKFPKCPYRSYGGNHCSHKGSPNICVFAKCLEKCEFYNEWVDKLIIDSDTKYETEVKQKQNI